MSFIKSCLTFAGGAIVGAVSTYLYFKKKEKEFKERMNEIIKTEETECFAIKDLYLKKIEKLNANDEQIKRGDEPMTIKLRENNFEPIPKYEIIDFDYPLREGYDSDCLKYYIKSDILTDDSNIVLGGSIDEILGPDVYDIVKSTEGAVYFINNFERMYYEVESLNEEYEEDPPENP